MELRKYKMPPPRCLRYCRYIIYAVFVLLVLAVVATFLDERRVNVIRQTLDIDLGRSSNLLILQVKEILSNNKHARVLQWRGEWTENRDICDLSRPPANVVSYRLNSGKAPFVIYGIGNEETLSISQRMTALGHRFSMKVDDYISKFLQNYPSTTFIDIGASIGATSVRMAQNGHHVIAVESDYDNVRGLCMSLSENRLANLVTIVHHSVGEDEDLNLSPSFNTKYQTNTVTADRILALSNSNSIVKIDTDGSEDRVILGSKYLLMSRKTRAIVLAWETHKGQRSGERILSMFSAWGFIPHAFRGSGAVRLDNRGHAPSFWPSDVIWLPVE